MQPKKLTPLEILQKQKSDLQAKSDELSGKIENNIKYLQQNFSPLLRDSLVESAVSKLPPKLQNLAGNIFNIEQKAATQNAKNSTTSNFILGAATGITEIAPLFLRGKKGVFLSILLKKVFKLVSKSRTEGLRD